MLVASITDPKDAEKAAPLADLIEYRLDHFPDLSRLPKSPLPVIFTFRKKEQGGARAISEAERLSLLEKCLALEPDYCDLEADTDPAFIARIAQTFPHVKLIGSYHNFSETPSDLLALLRSMQSSHFALYKIATKASSTPDMLRLMLFAKKTSVPLSVMALGEYGKPSRILAPIVGSVLDYAGLEDDPHLHRYSLQTLHDLFHYRRLNRETKVYALIGDPVAQSIGDQFHNPRFSHNAVYIKMRLRQEELAEFFRLIRQLPFAGLSVTMPLKEAIFPFIEEVSPLAQAIGAINTVILDQTVRGTNTDAPGALNALEKYGPVKGKRIALLGAGGSARAIAYEALQRGASVMIFNRTVERAKELAAAFGCEGYSLDEFGEREYDIAINTVPFLQIQPKTMAMDITYVPRETLFLTEAKKQGCQCIYGEEMFIEQALLQQTEWQATLFSQP